MFYDFYSKHIPIDADFFVCSMTKDLLPCNKYDSMLLKKLVKKNPEINIQEHLNLKITSSASPKQSISVSSLYNRDYNKCTALFLLNPLPFSSSSIPALAEDCQIIHRLYKLILERAEKTGAKRICLPLLGIREGIDVLTAFSILIEHLEAYRKLKGGKTTFDRIYAVVDQKKASSSVKKMIASTRNNSGLMRTVIRIYGGMTEPLYGNLEKVDTRKAEIDPNTFVEAEGSSSKKTSYGKDNLIDSLLFEN